MVPPPVELLFYFLLFHELDSGVDQKIIGPLLYDPQHGLVVFLVNKVALSHVDQHQLVEIHQLTLCKLVFVQSFIFSHLPLESKLQKIEQLGCHPVGQLGYNGLYVIENKCYLSPLWYRRHTLTSHLAASLKQPKV